MKLQKKFIKILLILCLVFGLLSGCSVSLPSRQTELSTGGLVEKQVFEDARKNARMLTFQGKSGEFSYSWFFNGSSVSSPASQNLKVDIEKAGSDLKGAVSSSDLLKLVFHENHLIQAQTTLRIDFPGRLDAQKVRIYRKGTEKIIRLLEAPLNQDKTSSVTIPADSTGEVCYLAVMDSSFTENPDRVSAASGSSPPGGSGTSSGVNSGSADSSAVSKVPSSSAAVSRAGQSGHPSASRKSGNPSRPSASSSGGKDRYQTDSIPAGKPKPVEPQDVQKNAKKIFYCTLSIDCKTILNNMDKLKENKKSVLPSDGVIFKSQQVLFYSGESVFDVLQRETKKNGIQMEYQSTPGYNSSYIVGIHNLYEFDCGELSGWTYQVNGWRPNYGCSRYLLKDGDVVQWRYTCNLGKDIGDHEKSAS